MPVATGMYEPCPSEPPAQLCNWSQFIETLYDSNIHIRLRRSAWEAGFKAQSIQAIREREAGNVAVVPDDQSVNLELIMCFFRSVEAGEYMNGPVVPGFRKTAWKCWSRVVNKAFGSDGIGPRLVRGWEDGIHPRLLPAILRKTTADQYAIAELASELEERYQLNTPIWDRRGSEGFY